MELMGEIIIQTNKDFVVVATLTLGYGQVYYSLYYKILQLNFFCCKIIYNIPRRKKTCSIILSCYCNFIINIQPAFIIFFRLIGQNKELFSTSLTLDIISFNSGDFFKSKQNLCAIQGRMANFQVRRE